MLVLTRRPGQKIMIGHDIVLTLCEIRGDKARIGIDAPAEVSIVRDELYEAPPGEAERSREDSDE